MICAKCNNVDTILTALRRVCGLVCAPSICSNLIYLSLLRRRLSNSKEQETLTGIEEVKKISRLRAADLVKIDPQVSKM